MIYTLKIFHTTHYKSCTEDARLCGQICVLSSSYSCQLVHQAGASFCIFGNCKIPCTLILPQEKTITPDFSVAGPKTFFCYSCWSLQRAMISNHLRYRNYFIAKTLSFFYLYQESFQMWDMGQIQIANIYKCFLLHNCNF